MKKIVFCIITFLFITFFACEKQDEQTNVVRIINFSHTDCKKDNNKSVETEYIKYKTVDKNYLEINHINTIFNCCPGELTINASVEKDTITIFENESEQACKCLCPYDLNYTFGPIEYGKYHVIVNKNNSVFTKFIIDFNENTNGTFVIESKGNL